MDGLDYTHFFPQVLQAVPTDDYMIYLYFNDGSVHCYDVKPHIKPDTVFSPLADINLFKSNLTVLNDTAAWDMSGDRDPYACIDLDPETLFQTPEVDDPLDG